MTDDRLHKALEFANYRQTFFNQKQILKNKSEALLSYSTQGGTFKVTQELIAFAGTFVQQGYEEIVLLDVNENPIKIDDLKSFLTEITSRYFEVTNDYHKQYSEMQTKRRTAKLVEPA